MNFINDDYYMINFYYIFYDLRHFLIIAFYLNIDFLDFLGFGLWAFGISADKKSQFFCKSSRDEYYNTTMI